MLFSDVVPEYLESAQCPLLTPDKLDLEMNGRAEEVVGSVSVRRHAVVN